MEESKICSFFGHREIERTEDLYRRTENEIRKLIDSGYRVFYFGGYGDFDALCYEIVNRIKEEPERDIQRVYCVAQEQYLRKKSRYFRKEDYDEIIYLIPSFNGWYKSIYYRNCAMIDESETVLFYAEARKDSGAYKAYRYAKTKQNKTIINLWQKKNKKE